MKILILSKICNKAIKSLGEKYPTECAFDVAADQLPEIIGGYDVLIFRSGVALNSELLKHAKALKLIIRAGSGMDSLDVEYAESQNIQVKRIPEPAARAVAEIGLGLMLCLARKIIPADKAFRQGHWAKNEIQGRLLAGKTLGVVGAGNIGSYVGQLGNAMGMRVIGCVEHPSHVRSGLLKEKGIELQPFSDVIEKADFLSIHVPLKASTRGLINGDVLPRMKVGSFLINLSRGGVVDEQALFQTLSSEGGLMGAAVDVHQSEGIGFSSPLSSLSNVILTPHIGSQTIDTQQEIGKRVVEIVEAFSEVECPEGNFYGLHTGNPQHLKKVGSYEKDQTA